MNMHKHKQSNHKQGQHKQGQHKQGQHMQSKHMQSNHYTVMFVIMLLAGGLSTMNIWADKYADMRFSLNDGYMILLMTGWMFLFMGLYYREMRITLIGAALVLTNLWCIRTQFMIDETQYKLGMIPHHSMAIHMSKKLAEKPNTLPDFLTQLIDTQEKEIVFMQKI